MGSLPGVRFCLASHISRVKQRTSSQIMRVTTSIFLLGVLTFVFADTSSYTAQVAASSQSTFNVTIDQVSGTVATFAIDSQHALNVSQSFLQFLNFEFLQVTVSARLGDAFTLRPSLYNSGYNPVQIGGRPLGFQIETNTTFRGLYIVINKTAIDNQKILYRSFSSEFFHNSSWFFDSSVYRRLSLSVLRCRSTTQF